jgi:hypothetical protein
MLARAQTKYSWYSSPVKKAAKGGGEPAELDGLRQVIMA